MRFLARGLLTLCFAISGAAAADNVLSDVEKADGWKLLFDGTATTGWVNREKTTLAAGWEVKDGVLTCKGGGDAVYKTEQFENFLFSIDWKIADKGNSGVFIR